MSTSHWICILQCYYCVVSTHHLLIRTSLTVMVSSSFFMVSILHVSYSQKRWRKIHFKDNVFPLNVFRRRNAYIWKVFDSGFFESRIDYPENASIIPCSSHRVTSWSSEGKVDDAAGWNRLCINELCFQIQHSFYHKHSHQNIYYRITVCLGLVFVDMLC